MNEELTILKEENEYLISVKTVLNSRLEYLIELLTDEQLRDYKENFLLVSKPIKEQLREMFEENKKLKNEIQGETQLIEALIFKDKEINIKHQEIKNLDDVINNYSIDCTNLKKCQETQKETIKFLNDILKTYTDKIKRLEKKLFLMSE